MKNIVRTLVVGGALVAASFGFAAPASAACTNNNELALHLPTVCVFYDNCDADICIGRPLIG